MEGKKMGARWGPFVRQGIQQDNILIQFEHEFNDPRRTKCHASAAGSISGDGQCHGIQIAHISGSLRGRQLAAYTLGIDFQARWSCGGFCFLGLGPPQLGFRILLLRPLRLLESTGPGDSFLSQVRPISLLGRILHNPSVCSRSLLH